MLRTTLVDRARTPGKPVALGARLDQRPVLRSRAPARGLLWLVGFSLGGACQAVPRETGAGGATAAGYGDESIGYKQQPVAAAANGASSGDNTAALGQGAGNAADVTLSASPSYASESDDSAMDFDALSDDDAAGDDDAVGDDDSAGDDDEAPVVTPVLPPDSGTPGADGGVAEGDGGAAARPDGGATASDAGAGDAGNMSLDASASEPLFCAIPEFDEIPEAERQPENPFRTASEMPASTFSIDVDTGSYTLARAAINEGVLPARDRVRIEEFINYFHMHYAAPQGDVPFSLYTELGECPWNTDNQLLMVGVQGQEVPLVEQPAANLVFLVDVSGSMREANKLPLLKQGFRMMARQLRPIDRVSIVTYAGNDAVVLQGVSGAEQELILGALEDLEGGGSTNGSGGIQRAYEVAQQHFIKGGNNRVLLATDGDFNVGITTTDELTAFIADKRETGVFLSVYGFGSPGGNYNDETAEQLADNGNGIYFFIDSPEEARRAFIHTATGSLLTVAKDVKLQVQFNPDQVKGYRLIGYENRVLSNSDFNNDSVDAGELGAGLSVTSFFELIPAGAKSDVPTPAPGTDPLEALESGDDDVVLPAVTGEALVELRVRYKGRDANESQLITGRYTPLMLERERPTLKFEFASGVAELAMQLRGSQYLYVQRGPELIQQLSRARPADVDGAVAEFIDLTERAHEL